MEEDLERPAAAAATITSCNGGETTVFHELNMYSSDIDSTCSTPYVSAPSSPGRVGVGGGGGGFFYSAPASPMHFVLCSSSTNSTPPASGTSVSGSSFEFDFSARFGNSGSTSAGSMSSADELFLNGQIRPMKLSTHLQRPQVLAPLLDLDEVEEEGEKMRGRDVKWRDRSLRRRTRSMSPLRSSSFGWHESDDEEEEDQKTDKMQISSLGVEEIEIKENEAVAAVSSETTPSMSASSSRSSSVSRSSKRWVSLKEFLYRSKSEGRNNTGHKFWSSISFSPVKDRKVPTDSEGCDDIEKKKAVKQQSGKEPKKAGSATVGGGKPSNGLGKRRGMPPPSAHELHYKANREKTEEMRKKTFLPYRQGLLGCLGFSSKSYGAMNGFARALNPVSSR